MPLARTVTKKVISAPSVAQSAPLPAASAQPAAQPDPADIMLSRRYAKAIEAAGKHEVVISGRDRL